MLNLFGKSEVKRLRLHPQPKGVDIDKPTGYAKKKVKKRLRLALKRQLIFGEWIVWR